VNGKPLKGTVISGIEAGAEYRVEVVLPEKQA
jgi:hypothetical protein